MDPLPQPSIFIRTLSFCVEIYALLTTEVLPKIMAFFLHQGAQSDYDDRRAVTSFHQDDFDSYSWQSKTRKKKYTLILDLDETLIHTSPWGSGGEADCRVEIYNNRKCRAFYVYKRPYLSEFLTEMSRYYEIVIFTASVRQYAEPLIDIIDSNRVISRRFFRDDCIERNGDYVKDLSRVVKTGLERTVIVDNSPIAYSMNEDNAVPIKSFYDDPGDRELLTCIPFLIALRSMGDVRKLLGLRNSHGNEKFRRNEKKS